MYCEGFIYFNSMEFVQLNMKKAFIPTVELNKRLAGKEDYICLISEPYRWRNRIAAAPPGAQVISKCGLGVRAAIFTNSRIPCLALDSLCENDCAVALLKTEGTYTCLLYTSPSPRDS